MRQFEICATDCSRHSGMLGFVTKGFYPSSPRKPQFAVHQNVIEMYNHMEKLGPSSKQVYIGAMLIFLQRRTAFQVLICPSPADKRFLQHIIDAFSSCIRLGSKLRRLFARKAALS